MDSSCLEKQHTQIRDIAKKLQIEIPNSEIEELVAKFNRLVHMVQGSPNASLVPDQETYFRNEMQHENARKQKIQEQMDKIKRLLPQAEALYLMTNPDSTNFYYFDDSSFEAIERCVSFFRHISGGFIQEFLEGLIIRFELIIERFSSEQSPIAGQSCIILVEKDGRNKRKYYYKSKIVNVSKRGQIAIKGSHGNHNPGEIFASTQQAIKYRPYLTLYECEGELKDFLFNHT